MTRSRVRPIPGLLKQTLNEALGVFVFFLDDCRTISVIAEWKSKKGEADYDSQQKLQEDHIKFAALDLIGKLNYLKERHDLSSPSEEHIVSLYKARRSLANKDGIISENDATNDHQLVVKLRSVQLKSTPAEAQPGGIFVTSEIGDMERSFDVGQKVELSKNEVIMRSLQVF